MIAIFDGNGRPAAGLAYLDKLFIPVSGFVWVGLDVRTGSLKMDAGDLLNKVFGRDGANANNCQMLLIDELGPIAGSQRVLNYQRTYRNTIS